VATEDGGYISTSNIEEEEDDDDDDDDDVAGYDAEDHVLGGGDTSDYMNIIVQRVLSTQIQQPERLQRHNLFQIFFIIKNLMYV
jgi:predicted Zn-dependent peptidase